MAPFVLFEDVLPLGYYFQLLDEFNHLYNSFLFIKSEYCEDSTVADHYPVWGTLFKPGGDDNVGDNLALISIADRLKYKAQKCLRKNLKLTRVNTNLQLFGQEATFHIDGTDKSWTFLVFVCESWMTYWGGEFAIQSGPSDYSYVPVIPNRGVLFNGGIPHKGSAPNRLCPVPRYSFAATYYEIG